MKKKTVPPKPAAKRAPKLRVPKPNPVTREDLNALRVHMNAFSENLSKLERNMLAAISRTELVASAIAKTEEAVHNLSANFHAMSAGLLGLQSTITNEANRAGIAEGAMRSDNKQTIERIGRIANAIESHRSEITESASLFRRTINSWVPARSSSFPVWLEGIEQQINQLCVKDGALYRILHEIAEGKPKTPIPPSSSFECDDEPACSRDAV